MAVKEFHLPDIGEGIAEGEIVSWKVEVGQTVKEEDEFVEVMTDKATVMITVPYDGVIKELKAGEGDVVPVESVIAVIDTAGGGGAAPASAPAAESSAPKSNGEPAPAPASAAPAAAPAPAPAGSFEQASPGKVLAAPATRHRARELGIDLHAVSGSGPRGRITNEDLEAFAKSGGAPAAAPAAASAPAASPAPSFSPVSIAAPGGAEAREERVPFVGLRRKIAEAMTRSMFTATHFTVVEDVNVTELVRVRRKAKEQFKEQGVNVTYLPFIMKAVVEAMKKFPMMNSALDESTNELVLRHYYNFGIATDTDNGLIVPVVKDVDRKSIVELARDVQDVAQKTREGTIGVDNLTGGTFSITNAGNIGGLFATPIINFPEVAILGVHKIQKQPIVDDNGNIVAADIMYLSVSIDHRIVDGATGVRWLNVIKDCLENPNNLLFGRL